MSTSENMCPICCEDFNKSGNKSVVCEYSDCNFNACKTCVRTYLVGTTNDPNCMKCNKIWSNQFLVKNLNRSYCEKEYKLHRKQLLLDREISKLPETMQFAEQTIMIEKEEKDIKEVREKILELNKQIKILRDVENSHRRRIHHIQHGQNGEEGETSERRAFIMACPHEGCRGFLSSQYKCQLCNMFTCPKCLEVIGDSKDIEHTCNPDNVSTAEFIKKDTKPCPQCGTRIHKIAGCDQMWCTQCHVAFSYSNLKIDMTGRIHNPEYYRYLQQKGNGVAPRNPGDIICGGFPNYHQFTYTVNPIMKHALYKFNEDIIQKEQFSVDTDWEIKTNYLKNMHRTLSHRIYHDLPRMRQEVRDLQDNRQIRINYILNKIDKETMANLVYKNDIKRKRNSEILDIYELLNIVATENLNTLIQDSRDVFADGKAITKKNKNYFTNKEDAEKFLDSLESKFEVLDNLKDYCNKQFGKISVAYNTTTPYINELWEFETKKFKMSEITEG